jgi:hypothetical protein
MSLQLHGIDHLSPSAASTLVDCQRKYWWRYKHKLGRDERTEPLAMGGGLAGALEFGDLDKGIAEYHERRPIADGWTDPDADERAIWIAEATIWQAYDGYLNRYPEEGIQREVTYLIAVPGQSRIIQARVDGCKSGEYLIEDKLRSASGMRADALENEVRQGRQLTAEIYGHWKATGELLPVKFRITKKIDPRKVKPTKERVITKDYVETAIAEHFASDGVFNEFDATRTVDQLLEFEAEFAGLIEKADDLLASDEPAGARNEKACTAYGRTCPALGACQGVTPWRELTNITTKETS